MEVSGIPQGYLKTFTLTKAGTTSFTVPTGHRYLLNCASFQYVADATVATRIITLYIDHGTPETHLFKGDWTASQSLRVNLGIGNPAYAAYLHAGVRLPEYLAIEAGDVWNIGVSAGVAGDSWTCLVRVWDIVIGA